MKDLLLISSALFRFIKSINAVLVDSNGVAFYDTSKILHALERYRDGQSDTFDGASVDDMIAYAHFIFDIEIKDGDDVINLPIHEHYDLSIGTRFTIDNNPYILEVVDASDFKPTNLYDIKCKFCNFYYGGCRVERIWCQKENRKDGKEVYFKVVQKIR